MASIKEIVQFESERNELEQYARAINKEEL